MSPPTKPRREESRDGSGRRPQSNVKPIKPRRETRRDGGGAGLGGFIFVPVVIVWVWAFL